MKFVPTLKAQPTLRLFLSRHWKGFILCILYGSVGTAIPILNYTIFYVYEFNYPMILSGFGLALCVACVHFLALVGLVTPSPSSNSAFSSPVQRWNFFVWKVFPLSFVVAVTSGLEYSVYMYLPLEFIQMLRNFQPVVTWVVMFAVYLEDLDGTRAASGMMLIGGTWVMCLGESRFLVWGFILMVIYQLFQTLRSLLCQIILKNEELSLVSLFYYVYPVAFVWTFLFASYSEISDFWDNRAFVMLLGRYRMFCSGAIFVALLHCARYYVVKTPNDSMLMFASLIRNFVVICVAAKNYEAFVVSNLTWFGYVGTTIGYVLYHFYDVLFQSQTWLVQKLKNSIKS